MNSKIVPRALFAIPRTPTQFLPPKKLDFFCHSVNQSGRLSVNPCLNLDPLIAAFARQSFVVKAEEGSGQVVEESEVAVEESGEVEEEGGENQVEEEIVREPRKPIIKLGDVMGILNKRAIEASEKERPIPDIRTGDVVEIKLEVPENRRRLSIYKGIVISKQNAGIHTTIRVRRIIAGVGVEIVFPVYSPNVKEIRVVSHRKVRRARLYYLRDKLPRLSTFK